MRVTAADVARALDAKQRGGYWIANCPCHEDTKESLSIAAGDKRPVLVKCHAGCENRLVLRKCLALAGKTTESPTPPRVTTTAPKTTKSTKSTVPDTVVAHYVYRDENGEPLYRKTRYEPKDFRIFYYDGDRWRIGRGKADERLYRLDKVKEAREKNKAVLLVEGEKDVEYLLDRGLFATTALSTSSFSKEVAKQLDGLDVVVIPDNDKPGIEAAHKRANALHGVAKSVRIVSCEELGLENDHDDIYDFFHRYDGTVEQLKNVIKETPLFKPPKDSVAKKEATLVKDKKKADFGDYVELFDQAVGEVKRDIFSGLAVCKRGDQWTPLLDTRVFAYLRNLAHDSGGFFSASRIEDAINGLTGELERELCVDIPKWDGRDRIMEICECVQWENVTASEAAYFIKHWGATAAKRVMNPWEHRNRAIVLQSPSHNIGKDVLCRVLTGGAGQYSGEPALNPNNERDMFMLLADLMFAIVPEFDKLAKFHSGAVKDMITRNSAKCRLPYAKTLENLTLRTSFIGSCNTLDFYFDHTGAQRFVVLKIQGEPGKAIDFSYPSSPDDQKQIFAQYFEDAVDVDDDIECVMDEFNSSMTPDDPGLDMLAEFDEIVTRKKNGDLSMSSTRFTNVELVDTISALAKSYGFKPNKVRRLLKQSGRAWRNKSSRGYCVPADVDFDDELPF